MSEEQDHIRPYSQVQVALTNEVYFVLEPPAVIRKKIQDLLNDDEERMGMEGAKGKPLTLTAIELWAQGGEDGFEIELFELTTYAILSRLRGISAQWWERYLDSNRERPRPAGADLGVVIASGIAEAFSQGPAQALRMEEFEEKRQLDCCCGHVAAEHVTGDGEFVGECGAADCRCGRFHTHLAVEGS